MRPRKSTLFVSTSSMRKRKGRSTTYGSGMDVTEPTTAVAAAASVPCSSTAMKA
ncbi:hypothetical protein CYFUS_000249 [Cystobacter fuscus]|uniref:Uncharacterized protein n=1 Tax=Cystobacter fuscus TaxID=43 RepID=A0A250IUC4_9BACT|nr:hypothetical protein CYFUS_000249 [Cystobacter fuscus]